MNIRFKTVELNNFMSFEHAEVNLESSGYTMITGENENPDDNALSNGAGKSTIFESVVWALTGETIRGHKEVKRIGSTEKCEVKLAFSVDTDEFEVIRTKDPSNLKVIVNSEDKSGKGIRDTNIILSQYLPDLTASLIGSVIILGQGLPQRFTNNTPAGRKDVLEKLSKSDFMIEDLKRRIQGRKEELNGKIRELEDAILVSNTKKKVAEGNKVQAEAKLEILKKTDVGIIKTQIEELSKKPAEITTKITSLETEKSGLIAEATAIKEKTVEKQQLVYEKRAKSAEAKTALVKQCEAEVSPLRTQSAQTSGEISSLKSQILKIKSIKDVCPTCGQKLPDVVKPSTDAEEKRVTELTDTLSKITVQIDDIKSRYDSQIKQCELDLTTDIRSIEAEISTLNQNYSEKNSDVTKIDTSITLEKNSLETIARQITSLQEMVDNHAKDFDVAQGLVDNAIKDMAACDEEILYNTSELESIKLHMDVINKMNTVITRDFRGHLLKNVIDYIDKKAKEYSQSIFGTDKISFALEGNNISISYCGKQIEALSGGEHQKCDIIIQFAIRDMLCNFLDFSCNILVLDEIADNVDALGADKLFSTIASKLNDVDSIYIVSHHSDFPIPQDRELKIIKGVDGISRVA